MKLNSTHEFSGVSSVSQVVMRSRPLDGVGAVGINLPESRNAAKPVVLENLACGVEAFASDDPIVRTSTRREKLGAWLCVSPTGGL
jgi:hypothetical protein